MHAAVQGSSGSARCAALRPRRRALRGAAGARAAGLRRRRLDERHARVALRDRGDRARRDRRTASAQHLLALGDRRVRDGAARLRARRRALLPGRRAHVGPDGLAPPLRASRDRRRRRRGVRPRAPHATAELRADRGAGRRGAGRGRGREPRPARCHRRDPGRGALLGVRALLRPAARRGGPGRARNAALGGCRHGVSCSRAPPPAR